MDRRKEVEEGIKEAEIREDNIVSNKIENDRENKKVIREKKQEIGKIR